MPLLSYRLVNVFAESAALTGNPLCVFENGSPLDETTMQALALQFNLSETTFILPPVAAGATARVRIFAPTFEMPFAGHPTLGTAHVVRELMKCGDDVSLEMKAGLIPVRAHGDEWTLQANSPRSHAPEVTRAEFAQMLAINIEDVLDGAQWVDTGSEQLVIPLASPNAVERCKPDPQLLARYSVGKKRNSLAYVWAQVDEHKIRARFFFTKYGGVVEDPGTGSACANLGGWFIARLSRLPLAFDVRQGDHVGRPCRLGLRVDSDRRIFVSGRVIAIGRGDISI